MTEFHPTDDCKVPLMWDHEVENVAEQARRRLPGWDDPARPIWSLLHDFAERIPRKASIVIVPDHSMGRAKAFVSDKGQKLVIRESVAERARENTIEARFDMAHEIGHMTLHANMIKLFRMVDGNVNQPNLAPHESSEHQADTFARAFLLPNWFIEEPADPAIMGELVGMSIDNVARRLTARRNREEKLKRIVVRSSSTISKPSHSPSSLRGPELEQFAWDSAAPAPGYDPKDYRLSRGGFLVKRSDRYKRSSDFGWFLDGLQIISTLELLTN